MTQELEEENLEEEYTIQPMDDEPSTSGEQPLTGGYPPFIDMGIIPPPTYLVIDVCSVTFDQLKKRIM